MLLRIREQDLTGCKSCHGKYNRHKVLSSRKRLSCFWKIFLHSLLFEINHANISKGFLRFFHFVKKMTKSSIFYPFDLQMKIPEAIEAVHQLLHRLASHSRIWETWVTYQTYNPISRIDCHFLQRLLCCATTKEWVTISMYSVSLSRERILEMIVVLKVHPLSLIYSWLSCPSCWHQYLWQGMDSHVREWATRKQRNEDDHHHYHLLIPLNLERREKKQEKQEEREADKPWT